MPSDIRNFFGGKGNDGAASSQERPVPTVNVKAEKSKGRGKRKVVSDSEDDAALVAPEKITPEKTQRKAPKKDLPKGEVITTSDYFASSGKAKPARSGSLRSKPLVKDRSSENGSKPLPTANRPGNTPKSKAQSTPKSAQSGRTSSRKKTRTNYNEAADDDEDVIPIIRVDDDSGDDIFGAEYKRSGKRMEDDYESYGEKEVNVKPVRRGKKTTKTEDVTPIAKDIPQNVGQVTGDKPAKGRKRKSSTLDDDIEADGPAPKTANGNKSSPAKKARVSTKKGVVESKEMQDIIDSIPMVRPPTPPNRDGIKKYDFKSNAQRTQQAPAAGSKEIPTGAENCLAGLTFVFTGILDALNREEGQELIKRYGGKITTSPSSKTSYVILGSDAGPKKLETIAKYGLKTINEDGLFELIRRLPQNGGDSKAAEKFDEKRRVEEKKIEEAARQMEEQENMEKTVNIPRNKTTAAKPGGQKNLDRIDSRLWTVKYAPTAINQICGNKAQVDKLQTWLRNFHDNARTKFKKPGKDGSGIYRAVMIWGGPGVGKTTAAHLVAKLEGYDIVESNASDTRSKKLVEIGLRGVLDTTSLLGYFAGDGKRVDVGRKKLVLIMDEVDGMSAGDRGGVGALAAVCKKTHIPIILICNDRKLPKMKPFDSVAYELQFRKPTTDQVRSRIMTILFREGMKDMISANVVNALIEGSRADIRQVINMISTAKVDQQAVGFDEGKKMSKAWEKHVILKPWDIVGKILGGGMFAQSSTSTLNDKIELYFNDHEFSSLMIQENYLGTNPILSNMYEGKEKRLKILELADQAAESISDGDLVDRMIHGSQQQWSLMPTHAVFSFVRPASFMSGSMAGHGQTMFTSWLGNNSKLAKLSRFVKEIQGHMRLRASGDRHEIRQQYLPVLWTRLVKGLELYGHEPSGIADIISLMDSYFLTKDDWDAIYELGVGPQDVKNVELSTKNKTAFTKTYNVQSHPLPFMKAGGAIGPLKKTRDKPDLEEAIEDSEDDVAIDAAVDDEEDEVLDLKKDKYVRAPKKKAVTKNGGGKKGKGETKVEDEHENENAGEMVSDESEEDVKSKKGKGRGKATAAKGKQKK